jgi:hypothetical protein
MIAAFNVFESAKPSNSATKTTEKRLCQKPWAHLSFITFIHPSIPDANCHGKTYSAQMPVYETEIHMRGLATSVTSSLPDLMKGGSPAPESTATPRMAARAR